MIPARGWLVPLLVVFFLLALYQRGHAATCIASHYGHGDGYNGGKTASGERLNTYRDMTAAMRSPQPLGSHVTVTNLANGRSVRVRINDRGPFVRGRCVDLSYAAARAIGMDGLARVSVE